MARKKSTDDIVLQRVSKRNMEKILSIEPMQVGDSFDNVLSRVLVECERQRAVKKEMKTNLMREEMTERELGENELQDIFTIGTNGKKISDFVEILKKAGIETVIDVRKSARSFFVPEFSEKSLSVELPKIGINYIHKTEFGVPSDIVKRYTKKETVKGNGPLTDSQFEDSYREKTSNEIIDTLVVEMKDYGKTVLLCACAYAVKQGKQKYNCHRSTLANILMETGKFKGITHL